MQLKIVSDGLLHGTRVETEDGRELRATRVEWKLDAKEGVARATVYVLRPALEALVDTRQVEIVEELVGAGARRVEDPYRQRWSPGVVVDETRPSLLRRALSRLLR